MRIASAILLLQAAAGVLAAPAAKAASLQDVATVGFATKGAGTSGGKGGKVIRVSSLSQLEDAVHGPEPAIVVVTGHIKAKAKVRISSNKSLVGAGPQAHLEGISLIAKTASNIIIRNLKISKVVARAGDAITIQASKNIWIDHIDLSSDRDHGKDYYDGLLDVTHGSDYVTISNCKIHDHYKASLIGHSNKNIEEDTGHLHVTMVNNYWYNVNSRAPSVRFGTVHVYDSVFVNVNHGINVRKGGEALVEHVVFANSTMPLYSVDSTGRATHRSNILGPANSTVSSLQDGALTKPPYEYTAEPIAKCAFRIRDNAGVTLKF